jgi:biotin carboxyl carrier protein
VQFEVEINGRSRQVVVNRTAGSLVVTVDGRPHRVDAARIDSTTMSLLVGASVEPTQLAPGAGAGRAWEVTVAPDAASGQLAIGVGTTRVLVDVNARRRYGAKEDEHRQAGAQAVQAPMPGKIVRVLVRIGEAVAPRQPLIVVEAMKMENELRASRAGTVAEIRAQEGQSVDAGALLVVIQ